MKQKILQMMVAALVCAGAQAQVNSGSNGSDGAFNPASNIVIDMADHPNGIYQYTSVNISNGVTVTFIPNANNTPVTWLVQSDCTIAGTVSVQGNDSTNSIVGANGGPGGSRGGNGTLTPGSLPGAGLGLGGGQVGVNTNWIGGNGSYATIGDCNTNPQTSSSSGTYAQYSPGNSYGNIFELPLLGGSGGSGDGWSAQGGGGGGGAILIAASGTLSMSGRILAKGGNGYYSSYNYSTGDWYQNGHGGAGSGGAIRLIASAVTGNGILDTTGGSAVYGYSCYCCGCNSVYDNAGNGRIRIEGLLDTFTGGTAGVATRGYTGIIFMPTNQQPQLLVVSVGGVPISASPTGVLSTPDAVLSAQQNNPIPAVVSCANLPLNTLITVSVLPANGASVSATGYNNTGTQTSSTATISVNIPRGGGLIYATAATSN
ncbi:MAG: hypothetical protein ABSB84_11085 [Verrucomicrobiota bacterium]|jgi:hypothetical protein